MSCLQKETVQAMADTFGFADLSDDVASALASDLEYRLRELTQEAAKFTRQSKRRRLSTNDINLALRLRNLEPLYGYGAPEQESEPLGHKFKKVSNKDMDVFYTPEDVIDLAEFIKEPLPKCPVDTTFSSHWLAIDGVQPAVPQNPKIKIVGEDKSTPAVSSDNSGTAQHGANTSTSADGAASAVTTTTSNLGPVVVKNLIKHELSREQQLYYKSVTEGLMCDKPELRKHALTSIGQDPGIHQLLPYFTKFLKDKVTERIGDLNDLTTLVLFAKALLKNDSLQPELYLQQMIPAVLTCVVHKSLSSKTPGGDHWALRKEAATVVQIICKKFGELGSGTSNTVQSRVTKTLVNALLDTKRPLSTHYGAIVTLSELGPRVVDALIVDNVAVYAPHLQAMKDSKDRSEREDAAMVENALLETCGNYIRSQQSGRDATDVANRKGALPSTDSKQRYDALKGLLGEKLDPYFR